MSKKANFTAGPAILPESVEEKLRQATHDFNGTGVPIWSTSHRHEEMERLSSQTAALVKELLHIPDGYSVVFCPGGATTQFKAWLLNMKNGHGSRVGFFDSGHWSGMAIKAARELESGGFCSVQILYSSESDQYRSLPKISWWAHNTFDYAYITSNETVNGTQVQLDRFNQNNGIVVDMTSDIMSRPFDVSRFDLMFAGAQKNLGIAGTTLVIVRDSCIAEGHPMLPAPLSYAEQKKSKGALRNTPDTLALLSVYYMLEWIKESGGVVEMEKQSRKRSSALYAAIDDSLLFEGIAWPPNRSMMNVIFRLRDNSRYNTFLDLCSFAGIVGIEGHTGANKLYGPHLRASLYNGQTMENVHKLIEVMQYFEKAR